MCFRLNAIRLAIGVISNASIMCTFSSNISLLGGWRFVFPPIWSPSNSLDCYQLHSSAYLSSQMHTIG